MRRFAGLFVLVLLAAGLSGSARESVAVAKPPAHATAVLALVEAYNGSRLAWLDPATLRPLARRSVQLPGGAWGPVRSPNGRSLALGGPGAAGVRIVDLRRMKLTARVGRSAYHRRLTPLAWPDPRRLLQLDSAQSSPSSPEALVVLDPASGRVISLTNRSSPARTLTTWVPVGRRLVALSRPLLGMAAVRLEIHGAGGAILRAAEVDILAGSVVEDGDEQEPRMRVANPAFAVDSAANRAFVVSRESVAEVDLETLEATLSQLGEPRSLISRIHSWLEPEAEAKLVTGWSRQATSLGGGVLAVSGSTHELRTSTPTGLQLVDTRTGKTRMLESRATSHNFVREVLLAFGASRDAATEVTTGMGLAAFDRDGKQLWTALGDEPVWWVEAAGGYAYVVTPEEQFPSGVRVIDLATGAVVRTVRGNLPYFVASD